MKYVGIEHDHFPTRYDENQDFIRDDLLLESCGVQYQNIMEFMVAVVGAAAACWLVVWCLLIFAKKKWISPHIIR